MYARKTVQYKLRVELRRAAERLGILPQTLVHKRMLDTQANGDHTWQLCDPAIFFVKSDYSYSNNKFATWAQQDAKYHWKYVTCVKCLALKEEKCTPKSASTNMKKIDGLDRMRAVVMSASLK